MTATGQDLMAADNRHAGKLSNAHEAGDAQPMLDCSVSTIRHQADQNNATANGVHPLVIGTYGRLFGRSEQYVWPRGVVGLWAGCVRRVSVARQADGAG